ncbi:hypothetical protein [Pseudomonas sp. GL-B-19]|uniref:hypothetical protein n=1 Tax=Pseudomonas sp. GL-B-19 TaxID=2832393 RepID=UPI001CBB3DBD|nr:hypothetical protein [Pseudomonas sp. GL-B-19]
MRTKLIIAALGLFAATGVLAEPRKIEAVPFCMIGSESLNIRTVLEMVETPKGTRANDSPHAYREYWVIDCAMDTGRCVASELDLDSVDAGKPIDTFSLSQANEMRLASVAGEIATIVLGRKTFTLDMPKQLVTVRFSNEESDTVGSGPCAP